MLDYKGNPSDTRKHIYCQAFAIYALSEYYKATADKEALDLAINLFSLIFGAYYTIKGEITEGQFVGFILLWYFKLTSNGAKYTANLKGFTPLPPGAITSS